MGPGSIDISTQDEELRALVIILLALNDFIKGGRRIVNQATVLHRGKSNN